MIIKKNDFDKVNTINLSFLADALRGYGLEVHQTEKALYVSYKREHDGAERYQILLENETVILIDTAHDDELLAYGTPDVEEPDFETDFAYTCLSLIRERW